MEGWRCIAGLCLILSVITVCYGQGQVQPISFGGRPQRPVPGSNNRPTNQGGNTGFNQSPRPVQPTSSNVNEMKGCNCLPESQCPKNFGQAQTRCLTEGGSERTGICCISQNAIASRVGPSNQGTKSVSASSSQIQSSFDFGDSFIKKLDAETNNNIRERKFIKKNSPSRAHSQFFKRSDETRRNDRIAQSIARASQDMAQKQKLSQSDAHFGLSRAKFQKQQTRAGGATCPSDIRPNCNFNSKYRTVDGTCNNRNQPQLGMSSSAFKRLLPPLYEDGIMEPRVKGVDGGPLPLARDISNTVLIDVDSPNRELSLIVMQFAQFLDHDIAHGPFRDMGESMAIECCRDGREVSPLPEGCFNIHLPHDDGFFAPRGQRCMNFVRTMLAPSKGCVMGSAEQINEITHWIDASNIYGSHTAENDNVRDRRTGLLFESDHELLPIAREPNGNLEDCASRLEGSQCFRAGDTRVNEQPGLIMEHTLWMREHNRVARQLRQLNPNWSPDQLYEESRRIVVAEFQHFIYNEWLPIILGRPLMQRLRIGALQSGFRHGYDINEDPRMANEFATSAFRFGHSMIQGIYRLVTDSGRTSSLRLREVFNSPFLFFNEPGLIDNFVRGLTRQPMQNIDSFVNEELTNHLFQTAESNFGMDLMALNIQRGRDHAIATYSQLREEAGLSKPGGFLDVEDTIPVDRIRRLQGVYRNIQDVDAFVGGMAELPVPDGLLGPTFANIVGRQFQRSQEADRFFYDRGGEPGSFNHDQLQEIRKHSLAKFLCDNSRSVHEMQLHAFFIPSGNNPTIPCNQIGGMDLSFWRGERVE